MVGYSSGLTGFDCTGQVLRRIYLTITGKVIEMGTVQSRIAA